jgi:hypothetical protein
VPQIDLADDTWIRTSVARVAAVVGDGANWQGWWPDLDLVVGQLRGRLGVRWWVRPSGRHALAGSMEVWLEPTPDGVTVHYFLRLDPVRGRRMTRREAQRVTRAHAVRSKKTFWALKDDLESGRL